MLTELVSNVLRMAVTAAAFRDDLILRNCVGENRQLLYWVLLE